MDVATLKTLAHPAEHYNTLDDLINALAQPLLVDHTPWSAYRTVRDVLTGLCRADLNGLISAGDEHEWAAAALRANELALSASREMAPERGTLDAPQ